jgi:SAM-dependent methyltransferase
VTDLRTSWPGKSQREPSVSDPGWSVRRPLADWLEAEGKAASGKRVLDVGCGAKPYFPFFASASEYIGLDVAGNPAADVYGHAESMPLDDEAFDLVLCTQVLEHADNPAAVIRELWRVTKPGGRVLASTHGVMVFHPNPYDHWRWTHTGLRKLFEENAEWERLEIAPGAGTAAGVGLVVGRVFHLLAKRLHVTPLARPFVAMVNLASRALDARVTALREPVPGALFANFHVTAVRSG